MARGLSGECDEGRNRSCSRLVCLGNVYEAIGDLFDCLVHRRFCLVWVTLTRELKGAKDGGVARYTLYFRQLPEERFYFLLCGTLGERMSGVGRTGDGQ